LIFQVKIYRFQPSKYFSDTPPTQNLLKITKTQKWVYLLKWWAELKNLTSFDLSCQFLSNQLKHLFLKFHFPPAASDFQFCLIAASLVFTPK
jgi:hypothetical protein